MARDPRRVAQSYDEIVRHTVPDPDSSWRPSPEQEREARHGARHLDEEELQLRERVCEALVASQVADLATIDIEIDRSRVTLRGSVHEIGQLDRIERVISRIEGVEEIVDWLVVKPAE